MVISKPQALYVAVNVISSIQWLAGITYPRCTTDMTNEYLWKFLHVLVQEVSVLSCTIAGTIYNFSLLVNFTIV